VPALPPAPSSRLAEDIAGNPIGEPTSAGAAPAGTENAGVEANSRTTTSDVVDLVIIDYLKARHAELYAKLRNVISSLRKRS